MQRVIVNKSGTGDSLTYEEALEMASDQEKELQVYLTSMVNETVEDDEERANTLINLFTMITRLSTSSKIAGYLMDENELKELFGGLAEYLAVEER